MSENQKEDQVVTNDKSSQHNQSNQSNQDYQKKSGDASHMPPVIHEDKIQTEVPKQHHAEEQDRFRKTPVAGQEQQEEDDDENQQEEFEAPVENEKQSDTKDVE